MQQQQIEAYGTKKYYDEFLSNLLAQSKQITPIAKCVRVLAFNFSASTTANSINYLTVPFDVVRVKAYLIGIVKTGGDSNDLHIFECSLNNGYGIGSISQILATSPTVTQPVEFIYQQPRSFQNEIVSMQSMSASTYTPHISRMLISLHLELSSM
jgi:hypothetical protein